MKTAYICSPYRAVNSKELDEHIEYARALTRMALAFGVAPITPHLYLTQCLDEEDPDERVVGMKAGRELLKTCDFVVVGVEFGISEGMRREIETAYKLGIDVVNADKMQYYITEKDDHKRKVTNEIHAKHPQSTSQQTPISNTRGTGGGAPGPKYTIPCPSHKKKISQKTIESIKEFMNRGCEYAGTQEVVEELTYDVLRECSGKDTCTDCVALIDCDDEVLVMLKDFTNAFWDRAVEKFLNVLETEVLSI